jgi:hypothetical protein
MIHFLSQLRKSVWADGGTTSPYAQHLTGVLYLFRALERPYPLAGTLNLELEDSRHNN